MVKASGSEGSYRPVSIALTLCRDTPSRSARSCWLQPRSARSTLRHVLEHLHRQEASEDHGAWLFARVHSDGAVVRLDRAFDHWPRWWRAAGPGQGHSLADLRWEIDQRAEAWRPAWSALVPVPVH